MNYSITAFLANTEFENIIKNELSFKKNILSAIEELKGSFSLDSNSLYILSLFTDLFDIESQAFDSKEQISKKLNTTLLAFNHPGTFESIVFLFRTFLNVEIDIILLENEKLPGHLIIKLRDRPKFRRITLLKSNNNTVFKLKTYKKKALLLLNSSDKYYISTFYSFIKTLVLAGVELSIEEPRVEHKNT